MDNCNIRDTTVLCRQPEKLTLGKEIQMEEKRDTDGKETGKGVWVMGLPI